MTRTACVGSRRLAVGRSFFNGVGLFVSDLVASGAGYNGRSERRRVCGIKLGRPESRQTHPAVSGANWSAGHFFQMPGLFRDLWYRVKGSESDFTFPTAGEVTCTNRWTSAGVRKGEAPSGQIRRRSIVRCGKSGPGQCHGATRSPRAPMSVVHVPSSRPASLPAPHLSAGLATMVGFSRLCHRSGRPSPGNSPTRPASERTLGSAGDSPYR
jgi:hypothetical protein